MHVGVLIGPWLLHWIGTERAYPKPLFHPHTIAVVDLRYQLLLNKKNVKEV